MPHLHIAVQPPSRVQAGKPLYPPVIARMSTRRTQVGSYFFAMAVLLEADGNVVDGCLDGNVIATGVPVDQTSSSSSPSLVFVFPDLTISYAGTYSIRLDIYKVSYANSDGATLDDEVETASISVVNREVSRKHLSSTERSFIQSLHDVGIMVAASTP
ncbi:Fc.00g107010.m01.CDS01 [Cosmosporella sp. VM-42]